MWQVLAIGKDIYMLEQLKILDSDENFLAVASNHFPDTLPIKDLIQSQEALVGGAYSDMCTLIVPATHDDSAFIVANNYILFQDVDGLWQEYRIMDVERLDSASGSFFTATCEHAFYELLNDPVTDIRPTATTATLAVIQVLDGTRWSIGTGNDLGNNSVRIYYTSVLAGLGAIAERWEGYLHFSLSVTGNEITSRNVDILTRRGSETGKRFEINKDMKSIKQTVNVKNLQTALYGRGKGEEIETDTGDSSYGRRLTFADVVWTTGGGDDANKPIDQEYLEDTTAAAAYGVAGRNIFGFAYFDDITDEDELIQATYDELQVRKAPKVTYEMDVIMLEGASGYAHEAIRLGDTTNIINTVPSTPITGQADIIKLQRSLIDLTNGQVTLGNFVSSLATSYTSVLQQQQKARDREGVWDRSTAFVNTPTGGGDLAYAIDLMQVQLAASVTAFHTDANGNFIWENVAQTKALKIGAGILAIADSKTGGEYNYTTFGDGAGFLAEKIILGTLNANIVFAGTLLAASGTFSDLVAGTVDKQRMHSGYDEFNDPFFRMYDSLGNLRFTLTQTGFEFPNRATMEQYVIGDRTGIGIYPE